MQKFSLKTLIFFFFHLNYESKGVLGQHMAMIYTTSISLNNFCDENFVYNNIVALLIKKWGKTINYSFKSLPSCVIAFLSYLELVDRNHWLKISWEYTDDCRQSPSWLMYSVNQSVHDLQIKASFYFVFILPLLKSIVLLLQCNEIFPLNDYEISNETKQKQ